MFLGRGLEELNLGRAVSISNVPLEEIRLVDRRNILDIVGMRTIYVFRRLVIGNLDLRGGSWFDWKVILFHTLARLKENW